ncbi:MAG TPA: hypothetical protein VHM64_17635 [Candidatus Binatia bacterium]|nr:hypothetical protein [Candidatus Binatia bacterium]
MAEVKTESVPEWHLKILRAALEWVLVDPKRRRSSGQSGGNS